MSSSSTSKFAESETGVFWDVVDCPIPEGVSLDLACENIKSALAEDGYRGKVTIRAYCDTKESKVALASAFKSSGIKLKPAGEDRYSRLVRMLKDLMLFAVDRETANLMVISQDVSTESLCVKQLVSLRKQNRNLLLAQIDDLSNGGELFASVSSIWYWTDLSTGGKPAFHNITSEFTRAKTGVFWDVVDCPIPDQVSLDLVLENIKSALADDGYRGKVTISAYCDMKRSKAAAFISSGIKLVHAGDKRARRKKMLEDLYLFAIDHKPSSLMVISQDVSKDSLLVDNLVALKDKNRNLLVAQIDSVTGDLFASRVSSIWYWRDLSNGGKPAFHNGSSCRFDSNASGSSQAVAAINNWNLRRHVDPNTSGRSSQGVTNKRTRSEAGLHPET